MNKRTRNIAIIGMLVAMAMVISYIESQIVISQIVPGIKLGLTNIVVLIALYRIDTKTAIGINVIRIILVAFTFGNMFSLAYSLAGGLLSIVVMIAGKTLNKLSIITVSILGAIFHNIGQIIVAMFVLETVSIAYYLFVLWIAGIFTGVIVGIVSGIIVNRIPDLKE